ncbi:hypothetical protein HU200_005410 [Digitaria exilis]|uniref:DUF8039 domain-containing protein n=1 Tax=Digitaria exilis TaxID=1010633 RepID=A0A835KSQ2_9POAL|nr:hypothetical protein HU200_005410 [Digitaria exilis]
MLSTSAAQVARHPNRLTLDLAAVAIRGVTDGTQRRLLHCLVVAPPWPRSSIVAAAFASSLVIAGLHRALRLRLVLADASLHRLVVADACLHRLIVADASLHRPPRPPPRRRASSLAGLHRLCSLAASSSCSLATSSSRNGFGACNIRVYKDMVGEDDPRNDFLDNLMGDGEPRFQLPLEDYGGDGSQYLNMTGDGDDACNENNQDQEEDIPVSQVDKVLDGWGDLVLEIPGGDGESELGQCVYTWICWNKKYIKLDGPILSSSALMSSVGQTVNPPPPQHDPPRDPTTPPGPETPMDPTLPPLEPPSDPTPSPPP